MDHIILALDSSAVGGIETHVLVLAEGLIATGHRATILRLRNHGPHPMDALARARGLPLQVLSDQGIGLGTWLRRNRASLLHTHGYRAGIIGRLTRPGHGLPVVSTFHNGDRGRGKLAAYTALDRLTARLSTNIAVSEDIARSLPRPVSVIDNFVPMPAERAERGTAIGFVGRLSHEKGPDLFVELARRHPGQRFVMFGDGPMRGTIEATAPENLSVMGAVPGMHDHWPELGLLVMPSRQEGLPMAALEAMSNGIPVAAFAVGGLPRLVGDGVSGYIAGAGDMDTLSRQVAAFCAAGTGQREAMQQAARQRIHETCSVEARLPDVLTIYDRAMAGGRPAC